MGCPAASCPYICNVFSSRHLSHADSGSAFFWALRVHLPDYTVSRPKIRRFRGIESTLQTSTFHLWSRTLNAIMGGPPKNVSTYPAIWRQISIHDVGFDLGIQDRVRLVITVTNWIKVPPPTPHPQKTYMVPVKPMNQQNKHFDLTVTARDLHPYCSKGGNTLDIEINVNKNLSAMTFCHGAGQLYDGSITSKNFVHGK